ncbi:diguanylate cyclase [Paraconexibacter antarcticus]|uniref:Diguanylate cyclase n=1 Tax=Paraconexibacter antarcticus TaxID=2949664 RepID=A0ABY5DW77_9ACTN|nr:diguanylate cyclase [Paraconexibacter antarcticus]UTI65117.1 diguanylate cyclase [Paraconexibacter antarcticus]
MSARLARGGPPAAAAVAASVAAGWVLGARWLTSWGQGPTMKFGTAAAVVIAALAITLLAGDPPRASRRPLTAVLAVLVGIRGVVILAEWATGHALTVDRLVASRVAGDAVATQPSPHAAIGLVLLCGALLTVDAQHRLLRGLHVALTGLLGTIVAFAGVGWLFGSVSVTAGASVGSISLPTFVCFLGLFVGLVGLRPDRPPVAWLRGDGAAATMLRRLVPTAFVAPVLLGGARLLGEEAGWYDERFGLALFATSMIAVVLTIVFVTARTVRKREREGTVLQARLEATLDQLPGAVFLCDTDGQLQSVNRACAEAIGLPAAALVGRRVDSLTSYGPLAELQRLDVATVRYGAASREMDVRHADGTVHHEVVTHYPVRDEDGALIGIGGIALDITARTVAERALADAERRLRQLLESAPDAMVVAGEDGVIRTVNAQAERLFGFSREELVGSSVDLLIPAARRGAHAQHRAAFGSAPTARSMGAGRALRARRKDGSECPVEISLAPLQTEEGLLVTASIRDVTERARDEAEQAALRRVATAVAQDADPSAIFELVAKEVAGVLGVGHGSVVRFESEGSGTVLGRWTPAGPSQPGAPIDLDDGTAVGLVAQSGRPARLDAYPRGGSFAVEQARAGLRSAVAAPIRVGGRLWGAVAAATSAAEPLPAEDEARVERFADLVATAISNAQAWETLARQAATDAITGVYRTFHSRLRDEIERATRHRRPLAVVLFDLDRFKLVNDTHGHHAGDKVLAEVARTLAAEARGGEVVARVGGEEFAWLLPETDALGAFAAAERARRAVAALDFGPIGTVTVSAGVSSLEDSGDGELLVQCADRALYWAKDAGRNQTFRYTAETQAALAEQPHRRERHQSMNSIRALARAIDAKDIGTRSHSERVAALSEELARRCGWTSKRARQLHAAALLHDVGKIGIPDSILLKPSSLTADEYEEIKRHPEIGAQIAAEVLDEEPTRWVRHHHERWDGAGYPDGLAGHDVPDGAQLLALADAWDVMTTARSYQRTLTIEEARAECVAQRGAQFSPEAVDALLALSADELAAIRPAVLGA